MADRYKAFAVVLHAIQWDTTNEAAIQVLVDNNAVVAGSDITVSTPFGDQTAANGDWIFKEDVNGNYGAVADAVFDVTYILSPASSPSPGSNPSDKRRKG